MTDPTTRDPDVPPAGTVWCTECGSHAALGNTRCPCCNPSAYAFRMDPFVAPKSTAALPPMTRASPAHWAPEEDECPTSDTPSARLPSTPRRSPATSTASPSASTGRSTADSPTRLARSWLQALMNPSVNERSDKR